MLRTYTPGPEADAIVDQLVAKGRYSSADEVVRACLQLLQRHDAALNELMRLGEARDSATAAGRILHSTSGNEPIADIIASAEAGSNKGAEP